MKRLHFRHVRVPFNPEYPNGWRGGIAVALVVLKTTLRVQWHYRPADRCFDVTTFYAGNFRHMRHLLLFWRLELSYIPWSGWVPL